MFKIIGADGKEYGPVDQDQVRQWVRQGRANAQTRVLPPDATEWIALGELAEFEDVLGRAPGPTPPFPGAHSPLPEDVLERDYELDIIGCVSRGLDLLKTSFWIVFGVTAIFLLIQIAIQGFASIPIVGPVFGLGSLFVAGHLIAGKNLVILKVLRGEPTDVGEMFWGFKTAYPQLLLTYLLTVLLPALAALPGVVLLGVPTAIMISQEEVNALLVVVAALGLIVALVPLVYLSTCWIFSLPLVLDKGLGFWQAMETSRKVVSRHWLAVFGLLILVAVINMVGLLMCCIGLFLSMPLSESALMYAYETLFSRREAQPD